MSEATIGVTERMFDLIGVPIRMVISGTIGAPTQMSTRTLEPGVQGVHRVTQIAFPGDSPVIAGAGQATGTIIHGHFRASQLQVIALSEVLCGAGNRVQLRTRHSTWLWG